MNPNKKYFIDIVVANRLVESSSGLSLSLVEMFTNNDFRNKTSQQQFVIINTLLKFNILKEFEPELKDSNDVVEFFSIKNDEFYDTDDDYDDED